MEAPIDQHVTTIHNPETACHYYLPFLLKEKMSLLAIKKELEVTHNFSKIEISETSDLLITLHAKKLDKSKSVLLPVVGLIIGSVFALTGITLFAVSFRLGKVSLLFILMVSGGVGLITYALQQIRANR